MPLIVKLFQKIKKKGILPNSFSKAKTTVIPKPNKVETVTDFIFLGSKITVNSVCSHEIKTRLLLGRKATTNLESVLKSRDITLLTNVHILKAGLSWWLRW